MICQHISIDECINSFPSNETVVAFVAFWLLRRVIVTFLPSLMCELAEREAAEFMATSTHIKGKSLTQIGGTKHKWGAAESHWLNSEK
jgi:hypothetical protein